MGVNYFVSGTCAPAPGLLEGLFPGWAGGIAAHYIESYTHADAVILDPFAISDIPIREAAAASRRVVATNNNPLVVLLLRECLSPPDPAALIAAVTRLGDSLKRGIPLREHLDQLYQTRCPACRRQAVADYFVWSREPADPRQRWVTCLACGEAGLSAVDDDDLARFDQIETRGLHYWYLLNRAPPGDEARAHTETLLELYTPRAIYVIADLLMKIEASFDEKMQASLKAVLLTCLGAASNVSQAGMLDRDPHDGTRQASAAHVSDRTAQTEGSKAAGSGQSPIVGLRTPPRFIERNVWRLFEAAAQRQAVAATRTPLPLQADLHWVTRLPASPQGLAWVHTLGAGAVGRGLAPESVSLVLTAPPQPDPVSWSLAFLWTGWLFGPEQATRLKDLALKKWPDWPWYQSVMTRALRALHPVFRFDGVCVFAFSASSPQQAFALSLAAMAAGYAIESWQHRPGNEHQFTLTPVPLYVPSASQPEILRSEVQRESARAAINFLRTRGEPAKPELLQVAIWQHLVQTELLERAQVSLPSSRVLGWLNRTIDEGLEAAQTTDLYPTPGSDGQPAGWWLRKAMGLADPAGDQVELAVLTALRDSREVEEVPFTQTIYRRFNGPLTPEAGLIRACLEAYGEEASPRCWRLRPGEQPLAWQNQKQACIRDLLALGERLGYHSREWKGDFDVGWVDKEQNWATFKVVLSAQVAHFLSSAETISAQPETHWRNLVIPAVRTGLWQHKLSACPWLGQLITSQGLTFIKIEHLSALIDRPNLTRHDLKAIVGLDPLVERGEGQLPLF